MNKSCPSPPEQETRHPHVLQASGEGRATAVEQLVGKLIIAHLLSAALADQRSEPHGQLVLALGCCTPEKKKKKTLSVIRMKR